MSDCLQQRVPKQGSAATNIPLDKWFEVCQAVVQTLVKVAKKDRHAVAALLVLVEDADWRVREEAVVALPKVAVRGDPQVRLALTSCLEHDASRQVHEAAEKALARQKERRGMSPERVAKALDMSSSMPRKSAKSSETKIFETKQENMLRMHRSKAGRETGESRESRREKRAAV